MACDPTKALFIICIVAIASAGSPSKRGQGYQITPKACQVNRVKGICMFVWECIRHDGEHLGMCMDSFMFGSCCLLPDNVTVPTVASDINAAASSAVSTYISQQTNRPPPSHSNSIYGRPSTKRPNPNRYSSTTASPYLTSSQQRPVSTASPYLISSHQRPASTASPYLTSSQQRPVSTASPYLISSHQRPVSTSSPYLTSSQQRPVSTASPYLTSSTSYHSHVSTTKIPATSLSLPSTSKYPSTQPSKYPSITDNDVTQSKAPSISEKTTAMWVSSTEPAFVTRPKPTAFWSTSIRPRPPDFLQGSINGQRPTRPPKPTPMGSFITKKPSRPSPSQFITSTTMKHPTKPSSIEMKPITIDFITATTKRPTMEPPALLDFVTMSTKKPSTVMLMMSKPSTQAISYTTPKVNVSSTTTAAPLTSQQSQVTVTSVKPSAKPIQNRKECGVPPLFPRPEMRIVGGTAAPFGGWPWQVSVRRTSFFGFSSTHRCGGAVLNENWIATAGHCVDDLLTSQIRIRVGEYDFSSAGEPLAHEERGVARKVVHPRYNFFTYEYDLALVQLDRPLEFAPHVAPICLPGTDDNLVGETATVTGWGRLSEGGTLPSVLQEVSVPIVSNENCKSMFLRAGRHEHIPEIFLCAGYEDGGRDSCQGDSGGPLQVRGKDGRYFLAGIISWGIGCAESNLPGVCTRISKFVDWIVENVS